MADRDRLIRSLLAEAHILRDDGRPAAAADLERVARDFMIPRVLTREETWGWDGALLIEYNPDKVNRPSQWVFVDYWDAECHMLTRRGDKISYKTHGYNVTWRLWTAPPSEERRRSTPWTP